MLRPQYLEPVLTHHREGTGTGIEGSHGELLFGSRALQAQTSLIGRDFGRVADPLGRLRLRDHVPGEESGQLVPQAVRPQTRQPGRQLPGSFSWFDRSRARGEDGTGIETLVELQQRHPRRGVPRLDGSHHRRRSPPAGKQGEVNVDEAKPGDLQDLGR